MSSFYSGTTRSSGSNNTKNFLTDTVVYKFWDENVKGILFNVFYAMVKENNNSIGKLFLIGSFIIEFFEMIILCFRDVFKWGKLGYSFNFDHTMIGFKAYEIIFWIVASVLILSFLNFLYVGYTFYKGEIRQSVYLKTMRWFVTAFLSVLFMPIVYILTTAAGCNYGNSTLLLYPSQSCSGSHTPLFIVAVILLTLFLTSCFLCVLTYYDHDSNVIKSCARLQNRFEFLVLIGKLVIVLVAILAVRHPGAFLAVSVCVTFFLFLASVSMLPFYDHRLNLIRSGSCAGIFYVNIGMVASYVLDDATNMAPLVVFTAGIPVACIIGAVAADRRFKYLCDPSLVEGVISSEEMQSLPVQVGKKKKSVNFEQPKANRLLKNKLYSRLRFPWDVEIAARFIVSGNPNASLIDKGKIVYQTGLNKFPKSPTVLQGYANFMFTTVGDWQLGYVILEKLRKMTIMMDIQFFIYSYDKDRVRRTEGGHDRIGDFVDFMEYKKLQQQARRHHMTCLVCVRKFWTYLLEAKVDVLQLSLLSSKIAMAEKKATEMYAKLLANHPKNVSVLRDYAKFLDEVIMDERAAYEVRKKADKYEHEEMESITASHRSNNNVNPETNHEGENTSEHESEVRSENSLESWDERTVSSKSSGVNAKLVEARLDKYNSLKKLGYIMLATTAFVIIVAIVEVIVLNNMVGNYNNAFESQNTAGGAAHAAMRATRCVTDAYIVGRRLFQLGQTFPHLGTYDSLQADSETTLITLANNIKSLYWGDSDAGSFASIRFLNLKRKNGYEVKRNISERELSYSEFDHSMFDAANVKQFFSEPRYNQSMYVVDPNVTGFSAIREYETAGLWPLTSLYLSTTYDILSMELSDFITTATIVPKYPSISFCLENSQILAQGMLDLVVYYSDKIAGMLDNIVLVCMIIFCAAAGLLLIAVVFIFRPTVRKIFDSKVRTYTMFTLIPPSVVRVMTKKKIANMHKHDSSDDEGERTTDNEKLNASDGFPKWKTKKILLEPEHNDAHETTDNEATRNGHMEHTVLLPNSTDTPDQTNIISVQAASYDPSKIDYITPGPAPSPHAAKNFTDIGETHKEAEKDSLIVEIHDSKEEQPQVVKSLSIGKIFTNKIAALTDKFRSNLRGNTYRKVDHEEDDSEDEKDTENNKRHGKQHKKHSKKHSKLDVSSLNAVTRNLHLSYLIAIGVIIAGLLTAFLVMRTFLTSLQTVSDIFRESDLRTQYVQTVSMDLAILSLYGFTSATAVLYREYTEKDLDSMWESHKYVVPQSYQMDLLYTSDCLNIDETQCWKRGSPYYPYVKEGYDYAFYNVYSLGKSLLNVYIGSQTTLNASDPDYIKFRALAEVVIDGSERLTFGVYEDAKQQIKDTQQYIAIITALECVGFLFVYLILFRPFVKKLRAENEHTFSLIRMIPRKLLKNVPEIQEFIQETLDGTEEEN